MRDQPPPSHRLHALAAVLLLAAGVAVNWRLSQRQDELGQLEGKQVERSLELLDRYAAGGIASDALARLEPGVDALLDKPPGGRNPTNVTGRSDRKAVASWAEGLSPLSRDAGTASSVRNVDGGGEKEVSLPASNSPPPGAAKRKPTGSSGGSKPGARGGSLKDDIAKRISALRDVASPRLQGAGIVRRAHSAKGSHAGSSSHAAMHGQTHESKGISARAAEREVEQQEEAPIPAEIVSFEKKEELSLMAKNFHSLLKAAEGRITRCKGPKAAERPSIHELPLELPRYLSYGDLFVHQGNYRRLLGHGNFTQLRHPHLLPQSADALFARFGFDSCAVVGNSGALLYSKFGPVIDKHDVVFRLNQAPTKGYEEFTGKKTTFRLLNSLWTHRYCTMRKNNGMSRLRDFIWGDATSMWKNGEEQSLDATQLPLEKGAALIVSRCSVEEYDKLLRFWSLRRPDVMVLMLNSRLVSVVRALMRMYRVQLCAAGWGPFEGGADPTSGLVASYLALHMCRLATVYGFGSERIMENKEAHTPYHYYKFYGARHYGNSKAHSFDTELNMMAQLYNSSVPHPFRGHWRGTEPGIGARGNARMCRTERGYIANVHNLQCRGGWEQPSSGLRPEGPLKLEEFKKMQERHRVWSIPLADVEVPNAAKSKPAGSKWKAINLPSRD